MFHVRHIALDAAPATVVAPLALFRKRFIPILYQVCALATPLWCAVWLAHTFAALLLVRLIEAGLMTLAWTSVHCSFPTIFH